MRVAGLLHHSGPPASSSWRSGMVPQIDACTGTYDAGRMNWYSTVRSSRARAPNSAWAAASPVSARAAYRGVIEHSVYVATSAQERGVGRALLDAFVAAADDAGFWTIQSSVFPENAPSLGLHERCGVRVIGRREAIAQSTVGPFAGRWRDTILLERRRAR